MRIPAEATVHKRPWSCPTDTKIYTDRFGATGQLVSSGSNHAYINIVTPWGQSLPGYYVTQDTLFELINPDNPNEKWYIDVEGCSRSGFCCNTGYLLIPEDTNDDTEDTSDDTMLYIIGIIIIGIMVYILMRKK